MGGHLMLLGEEGLSHRQFVVPPHSDLLLPDQRGVLHGVLLLMPLHVDLAHRVRAADLGEGARAGTLLALVPQVGFALPRGTCPGAPKTVVDAPAGGANGVNFSGTATCVAKPR